MKMHLEIVNTYLLSMGTARNEPPRSCRSHTGALAPTNDTFRATTGAKTRELTSLLRYVYLHYASQ
jgi:hypothetical protein